MRNKLFVGGLPYSATDMELQKRFGAYGVVRSAKVIMDKLTGRSRGFGFVEMSSEDEARTAREALNGTQLEERTLVVNEAHPQKRGGSRHRTADTETITPPRRTRRRAKRSMIKL